MLQLTVSTWLLRCKGLSLLQRLAAAVRSKASCQPQTFSHHAVQKHVLRICRPMGSTTPKKRTQQQMSSYTRPLSADRQSLSLQLTQKEIRRPTDGLASRRWAVMLHLACMPAANPTLQRPMNKRSMAPGCRLRRVCSIQSADVQMPLSLALLGEGAAPGSQRASTQAPQPMQSPTERSCSHILDAVVAQRSAAHSNKVPKRNGIAPALDVDRLFQEADRAAAECALSLAVAQLRCSCWELDSCLCICLIAEGRGLGPPRGVSPLCQHRRSSSAAGCSSLQHQSWCCTARVSSETRSALPKCSLAAAKVLFLQSQPTTVLAVTADHGLTCSQSLTPRCVTTAPSSHHKYTCAGAGMRRRSLRSRCPSCEPPWSGMMQAP